MITSGMMSSNTDKWETPQDFFNQLDAIFHFELDVCALPENAKCKQFFTPDQDGLSQEWKGVCWMNPPYGREIGKWMKKAYETGVRGGGYSCLPRSSTDGHCMVA